MKSPLVSEVERHLEELAETASRSARELSGRIAEVAEMVIRTFDAGGKLFFCGNGGSAADAQHLATEYVVRFRRNRRALPAIALTTDTSLLTAASNDLGFEHVFARQIRALARAGDIVFLHSTSGRSPNLLEAARAARDVDARTVALLAGDGGPLRDMVDVAIIVPTANGAHAQELHLAIGHAVCDIVESRLAGHGAAV
ncbi:MAG TPA: SIS domain-containing protein [Nannocystis sp.]